VGKGIVRDDIKTFAASWIIDITACKTKFGTELIII
jgi:hypothetical protein